MTMEKRHFKPYHPVLPVRIFAGLAVLYIWCTPALKAQISLIPAHHRYPLDLISALRYRSIGPYRGGRSIAVTGVRNKPYTFYFGAAGGGLWKTRDGGMSWHNISDGYFKDASVGAVAVAPSDPNVIYAGTGESDIRGDFFTGNGIYKSTDGGKTWQYMGLQKTHVISKIVVDPNDAEKVYAAALGHVFANNQDRGIYRSNNGGKTWKKILYVNDETGAIDLAIDPSNPRVLYAAFWQVFRKPWIMSSGGPGSGLYKSTDGGNTWVNITHNKGLPGGILGKIGVTISPANPARIWALVQSRKGGVFRSDNGGKSWQRLFHGSELSQRAWYFSEIFADPKDANTVYACNINFYKSIDGGRTFSRVATPHGDNHDLWINPDNPDIMIESNDGGAAVTYDGGTTWTDEDQNTAQIYHVNLDNSFPYNIYGAQQDRSSVKIPNRTTGSGISSSDIKAVAGGESGFIVPMPDKPWITFGGSYIGIMTSYNERTRQKHNISVWQENTDGYGAGEIRYRFNWTFPILVSRHSPHALYTAAQYVFKSTDQGMNWTKISPDLTRNDKSKQLRSGGPITKDETGTENYDTIFSLAESPLQQGLLWAGSDDGLIHISLDDGKSWKNVTPKKMLPWSQVSTIDPSHFSKGTAYAAVNRYKLDDFHPYLYVTHDYGAHWKKITDGIPNDEYTNVLREDTKDKNLLFAGTQRGVYVSFNGGAMWQPLQLNLPHVPVSDLKIQNRENDLVVATHGRGFWIMDNLKPLRQLSPSVEKSNFFLFEPEHAYLMNGSNARQADSGEGQNPPNGAVIFYYLKDKPDSMTDVNLEFMTSTGDSITSFSSNYPDSNLSVRDHAGNPGANQKMLPAEAGMNRIVWDLRYPSVKNAPDTRLGSSGGTLKGPKVLPGVYKVKLTVGSRSQVQSFEVRLDPRINTSMADLKAEFDLLRQIVKKQDETASAIKHILNTRKQIHNYLDGLAGYSGIGKIRKAALPILDSLRSVENVLYQPDILNSEDDLNYPVKLWIKLASLNSYVSSAFARPPSQSYVLFDSLKTAVNRQLARKNLIMNQQVPEFNLMIHEMNIPSVFLKKVK